MRADRKKRYVRVVVCVLFAPVTVWYALVVWLRNKLFDWEIIKPLRPAIASIGIGNMAMGGTGKTPHCDYLLGVIDADDRCALISRGYGRESKGMVVADGGSTWREIGDEPYMLHRRHPELTVVVSKDRRVAVESVQNGKDKVEYLLFDDVYQHRYVAPCINILLTEYDNLWCDDYVLPFGNLREPGRQSRRADAVIVTKCPMTELDDEAIRERLHMRRGQELFFSHMEYGPMYALNSEAEAVAEADEPTSVLVVAGIAHPEGLVEHLSQRYEVELVQYADHHRFTEGDMETIRRRFELMPQKRKFVVTTEKDVARMAGTVDMSQMRGVPMFCQPIEVKMHNEEQFKQFIFNQLKQKR